jgi:hypothetical protein
MKYTPERLASLSRLRDQAVISEGRYHWHLLKATLEALAEGVRALRGGRPKR